MTADSTEEQKKLSGYLMLAEQAVQSKNMQEAIGFYNKALEIEPTNHTAWFGKAAASGWSTTMDNVRLLEMFKGLTNAIKFAPDDKKDELRIEAVSVITNVANATFNTAYGIYKGDPANSRKLVWPVFEETLRTLDAAHEINPKSIKLIERILVFTNNLGPVFGASDGQKAYMKQLESKYEPLIKELDPNHKTPTSGCFVVTATLGNENNIFVTDLRLLRDSVLSRHEAGRTFAKWYYRNGPSIAAIIGKSLIFRLFAFGLVVLPAYLICLPVLFLFRKKQ